MKYISLFVLIIFSAFCYAQIGHGGTPYHFSKKGSTNSIPTYTLPSLDITPFQNEDLVTDKHKDIPWRFGVELAVNIDLNNSGQWETLPNGDRIWSLQIQSPNAKSINLNYSNFYLPEGSQFFVYNSKQILGGFNQSNNKQNGEFSTSILKGDRITLEYYEPKSALGKGIINITSVVHGYRNLFHKLKTFGQSGACNKNVICDTTLWQDEIRSVVMILTAGNTRFCSGSLVNNVLQDGTPYVLTADHCSPSSNNIFMFNYESSDCSTNIDGPTNQTISGCSTIANDAPSDFFLVRLSSTPPSSYNVFYAGWSNIDVPANRATGIHHPSGDVKKISHDFDPSISTGYYEEGDDHWQVSDWNIGTTEGGSSGSPLFDQNHRLVGQLHGGDAACNNDALDYYGKFAISWDSNSDISKQLKHWLDPSNTGATTLEGFDPNGPNYTTDATILNISGIPNVICGDSASPTITIKNKGSNTLTSLDILYSLDGATPLVFSWIGNLATFNTTTIDLPHLSLTNGNHNFTVYTTNPNNSSDQYLLNDTSSHDFISNSSSLHATLNITTDDYGSETSWIVEDRTSGSTIIEGGGYPNIDGGQSYTEDLCLYDGCFNLILRDAFNDGYCCAFGRGNLLLTDDITGDTLALDSSFTGDLIVFPFCLGTSTNIEEVNLPSFNIYPNPNNGEFIIDLNSSFREPVNISIYNLIGKTIYTNNGLSENKLQLNLGDLKQGIYLVSIISGEKRLVKKLMIEN